MLWSELYGKTVPYIRTTKQEFIDALVAMGFPVALAEHGAEFLNAVAEGEFSETSNDLETILGRKPTSLKESFAAELFVSPQFENHLKG